MKRLLPLLLCLLLAGCGGDNKTQETTLPPQTTPPNLTAPTDAPVALYDPDSALERETRGALRVYPLRFSTVTAMEAMGEDLLIFSAGEEATAITRLTGDELQFAASAVVNCPINPQAPSLQIRDDILSYFDPGRGETVVLDRALKEVGHVAAPEGLAGEPLLSADRNTLYYCTETALMAWDLETGLHRRVKEMAFENQTVFGLHAGDTVVQCGLTDSGQEKTLLLSAKDGRLLYEYNGTLTLSTSGGQYFAALPSGNLETLVFGREAGEKRILSPLDLEARSWYLPEKHGLVTASPLEKDGVRLDYYDLDSGSRVSSLTLSGGKLPLSVSAGTDGALYVLGMDGGYRCEVIYRWDVTGSAVSAGDSASYSGPFYTSGDPDWAGLEECRARASQLGERYGIQILLWQDALAVQPWDYRFRAEYLVPVLSQALDQLEARLAIFPEGMLAETASHFTSLRLCLVRELEGAAGGPPTTADGLQFLVDNDAYIALAVGRGSGDALYRQLYHVMDTHVLSKSTALYRWAEQNPNDFSYDLGDEGLRDNKYLEGPDRAFVDAASKSFPKEDRAAFFARAMAPGQRDLFRDPYMQKKLRLLCEGIRNAYGLRKSPEVLPWEQYLQTPLAYQK